VRGSCNEPGPHDPDVVASLKKLAGKEVGRHGIVCESDGFATEYRLEGGTFRVRDAGPETGRRVGRQGGRGPRRYRDRDPGRDALRRRGDVQVVARAGRCRASDTRLSDMRQADGTAPEVWQILRLAPGARGGRADVPPLPGLRVQLPPPGPHA